MAAILIGVLLLVAAAALWHYSTGSPPVLLACVALALVGAILLVLGLLAVADLNGVEGAVMIPGTLGNAMRRRSRSNARARRFEKIASGLRANRMQQVGGGVAAPGEGGLRAAMVRREGASSRRRRRRGPSRGSGFFDTEESYRRS